MNFRNSLFAIIAALLVLSACDKENENPTIKILTPSNNAMFMKGEVVTFEMEAEDSDGAVVEVELYIAGEKVETYTSLPLTYDWHTDTLDAGGYKTYALVRDDEDGATTHLITVNINIPGGLNPDLEYGSLTDYDGNTYATIQIGEQTWMAENLRVTHYADGTPIAEVTGDDNWANLADEQAYCWYNDQVAYADTFGALYNWNAAVRSDPDAEGGPVQGVCPDGWHLPSDGEWQQLEVALGMSETTAALHDWRGSNEGGKLKELAYTHWQVYNDSATNASGFTALPGGFRTYNGSFNGDGAYATFWTATGNPANGNAWYRSLYYERGGIYRHQNKRWQGFSVRCVAD